MDQFREPEINIKLHKIHTQISLSRFLIDIFIHCYTTFVLVFFFSIQNQLFNYFTNIKTLTIKITFLGINVTSASFNWPFSRSIRCIRLDTRGKTTRIPLHATPPSQIPNKEKKKKKKEKERKDTTRSARFSATQYLSLK